MFAPVTSRPHHKVPETLHLYIIVRFIKFQEVPVDKDTKCLFCCQWASTRSYPVWLMWRHSIWHAYRYTAFHLFCTDIYDITIWWPNNCFVFFVLIHWPAWFHHTCDHSDSRYIDLDSELKSIVVCCHIIFWSVVVCFIKYDSVIIYVMCLGGSRRHYHPHHRQPNLWLRPPMSCWWWHETIDISLFNMHLSL